MSKLRRLFAIFLLAVPATGGALVGTAMAVSANPVSCLAGNLQCARAAASGDYACDPLPC